MPSRSSSKTNLAQAAETQEPGMWSNDASVQEPDRIQEASKPKSTPANLSASSASVPRSPASRGPRTPRTPRRVELQPTKLEALDDTLGPLGPLGASAATQDLGPTPPVKEQPIQSSSHARSTAQGRSDVNDDSIQASRIRGPPPVQPMPAGGENARRQGHPSMSIEQASKPSFDITVGDPHKVGDLTNSHIVYNVRTKVGDICSSIPRLILYRQPPKHTKIQSFL